MEAIKITMETLKNEVNKQENDIFGPPEGGPILFLLSPEVSGTSGTMSIYIYVNKWRTRNQYKIFRLYFSEIHSFAPDFISEGSFKPWLGLTIGV